MRVCGRVGRDVACQRVGFWVGLTGSISVDTRSFPMCRWWGFLSKGWLLGRLDRKSLGRRTFLVQDLTNLSIQGKGWGMSIKMVPMAVKIVHSKSSHKINIPIALAREMGFDKADFALVVKKGNNKLEVKRYDKAEDGAEYFQGNRTKFD